ncbi:hypothetical protein BDQ17DRAFT_1383276, partial [Cyathus striatus]
MRTLGTLSFHVTLGNVCVCILSYLSLPSSTFTFSTLFRLFETWLCICLALGYTAYKLLSLSNLDAILPLPIHIPRCCWYAIKYAQYITHK